MGFALWVGFMDSDLEHFPSSSLQTPTAQSPRYLTFALAEVFPHTHVVVKH